MAKKGWCSCSCCHHNCRLVHRRSHSDSLLRNRCFKNNHRAVVCCTVGHAKTRSNCTKHFMFQAIQPYRRFQHKVQTGHLNGRCHATQLRPASQPMNLQRLFTPVAAIPIAPLRIELCKTRKNGNNHPGKLLVDCMLVFENKERPSGITLCLAFSKKSTRVVSRPRTYLEV